MAEPNYNEQNTSYSTWHSCLWNWTGD